MAAFEFAPVGMALGVVSILYGAVLAFAQTDLKRLVAYTSVSHMGFVMLGVFAWNETALQGVVLQMLAHGISTGALFVLVGALQERMHTRDVGRMGGLWAVMPRLGGVALLFALASLGLPGLGNFVAEMLILFGAYAVSIPLTCVALVGLVLATVYALWFVQVSFFGPNKEGWKLPDLTGREAAVSGAMILAIVWLGLYPQPVINVAGPALEAMRREAVIRSEPGPGRMTWQVGVQPSGPMTRQDAAQPPDRAASGSRLPETRRPGVRS